MQSTVLIAKIAELLIIISGTASCHIIGYEVYYFLELSYTDWVFREFVSPYAVSISLI